MGEAAVPPPDALPTGSPRPDRLVWMDLEMTGLDPDQDVILEIATLVTDGALQVLAEGPSLAIHRAPEELARMDAWNQATHAGSGLLERVRTSGVDARAAERQTLAFLQAWVPPGVSPLCGNSVHQDRAFLRREMPALAAHFHYRNVDVSTIKELVRRWYPGGLQAPPKQQAHRALDDARESVAELRWYRAHVFRVPGGPDPPAEPPAS